MTFEKLSRPADAREALNKALAANPGYEPAMKRLAVMDGEPQAASAAGADSMQTATVTPASPTLPEPTAPSGSLLGGEAQAEVSSTKLFTDRVPQAETVATVPAPSPAPATESAEERILAIEEVPEDPPAPAAETSEVAEAPAASEPAEEPAEDAPKITGWSVQLASAPSEDAAWSTWKKMKARNKALANKEPVVVRADLGSKGIFYRVRLVGFESQSDASSVCSRLKARGVKCFISRAAS
jgi:hypothetical protein